MSFSVHHRSNTRFGFKLEYDSQGLPLASRETIAACLISGHMSETEISQATLAKVASTHATQVVTATDGPEEISDLLSSYLAMTPALHVGGKSMALVPDPSRLRNTSHEEWIRWLPHFAIDGVLHPQETNGIPHLLSRGDEEGLSVPPVPKVGSAGLSVPPMMPLVDQRIVVPRKTRDLHVMEVYYLMSVDCTCIPAIILTSMCATCYTSASSSRAYIVMTRCVNTQQLRAPISLPA